MRQLCVFFSNEYRYEASSFEKEFGFICREKNNTGLYEHIL